MREALLYNQKPTDKCRRKDEARKSLVDVNASGSKSAEDIYIVSTYLPKNFLLITKRKLVTFKKTWWTPP